MYSDRSSTSISYFILHYNMDEHSVFGILYCSYCFHSGYALKKIPSCKQNRYILGKFYKKILFSVFVCQNVIFNCDPGSQNQS